LRYTSFIRPFPKPELLRYYAWVIRGVWYAAAVALVLVLFDVVFDAPLLGNGVALVNVALVVFAVHLPLLAFLRCPHCNRLVTVQTFTPVHPKASAQNKGVLAGWGAVIMNASRGKDFVCIHCGEWIGLKTRQDAVAPPEDY
jgi:hypothetical protein